MIFSKRMPVCTISRPDIGGTSSLAPEQGSLAPHFDQISGEAGKLRSSVQVLTDEAHAPTAPAVSANTGTDTPQSILGKSNALPSTNKNGTRKCRKSLIYLVGDAGFEPATPAV